MVDKTFPCREGLSSTRVSSEILLVQGFLFPLGFYQDSSVWNKYFNSGFLLHPGLTHCWPMGWIRQAQHNEGSSCQFLPLQKGRCLKLNPAMGSDWKINSCSQLMLTNVLNRAGHTIMAYLNSLLPYPQA